MIWMIRFEDVYLSGYDRYMQPCWGPRSEARRYVVRAVARSSLAKCRSYYGKDADLAIVRVSPKRSTTRGA